MLLPTVRFQFSALTVSGLTMIKAERHPDQNRASQTQKHLDGMRRGRRPGISRSHAPPLKWAHGNFASRDFFQFICVVKAAEYGNCRHAMVIRNVMPSGLKRDLRK